MDPCLGPTKREDALDPVQNAPDRPKANYAVPTIRLATEAERLIYYAHESTCACERTETTRLTLLKGKISDQKGAPSPLKKNKLAIDVPKRQVLYVVG
jgi:hypothetical protein